MTLTEKLAALGVSEPPKFTKSVESWLEGVLDKLTTKKEPEIVSGETSPALTPQDAGWQEFVLGQLREDEVVTDERGEKRPRINGLRRLTEKLIGEVVASHSRVVKAPTPDSLSATVEHSIDIVLNKECNSIAGNCRSYTDVADVSPLNTEDDFARFSASVAATRAEARCYRKALYLYSTPSSEEMTTKTSVEVGMDWKPSDLISGAQLTAVDHLCNRLNINVDKLLSLGEVVYPSLKMMPKAAATKLLSYLNGLQQGKPIPEEILGYESGWQK